MGRKIWVTFGVPHDQIQPTWAIRLIGKMFLRNGKKWKKILLSSTSTKFLSDLSRLLILFVGWQVKKVLRCQYIYFPLLMCLRNKAYLLLVLFVEAKKESLWVGRNWDDLSFVLLSVLSLSPCGLFTLIYFGFALGYTPCSSSLFWRNNIAQVPEPPDFV